jgi:putative transposase
MSAEETNKETSSGSCRVMRVRFQRTPGITRTSDQMRRSMATLWNDMVRVHKRVRKTRWKWPKQAAFDAHFIRRKARYAGLPSACIQQAVRKFYGNLKTTREKRKLGQRASYPWRDQKHFATVVFRGDLVSWSNGKLTLGGGNGSPALSIPMREAPGRILKAELCFDEVLVTVEFSAPVDETDTAREPVLSAGDPGQRWAWTFLSSNGESLMINGRAIVAEKIRREKKRAYQKAFQAHRKPGSRRQKKTNRTMARQKAQSVRRMRDGNHKVSHQVVEWGVETGQTRMILSQPTGIAKARGRKSQRQRNGYWEYGQQSRMIEYKAEGLIEIERDEERGTSSTCPQCKHRSHPSGRSFHCPNCGWRGHRDLVGSGNQLGRHDPHADVAALIDEAHPKYLRPWQQGRSKVVETDRPQFGRPAPLEQACAPGELRKWLARDYGGREVPGNRCREAAAQPYEVRGKILEFVHATPRTPAL